MDIIIHGCSGRMGRMLTEVILEQNEHKVICGVDRNELSKSHTPFTRFCFRSAESKCSNRFHILCAKELLGWCILHDTPVVTTTGLGPEEHRIIQDQNRSRVSISQYVSRNSCPQ